MDWTNRDYVFGIVAQKGKALQYASKNYKMTIK